MLRKKVSIVNDQIAHEKFDANLSTIKKLKDEVNKIENGEVKSQSSNSNEKTALSVQVDEAAALIDEKEKTILNQGMKIKAAEAQRKAIAKLEKEAGSEATEKPIATSRSQNRVQERRVAG